MKSDQQNSKSLDGVHGIALCRRDLCGFAFSSGALLNMSLNIGWYFLNISVETIKLSSSFRIFKRNSCGMFAMSAQSFDVLKKFANERLQRRKRRVKETQLPSKLEPGRPTVGVVEFRHATKRAHPIQCNCSPWKFTIFVQRNFENKKSWVIGFSENTEKKLEMLELVANFLDFYYLWVLRIKNELHLVCLSLYVEILWGFLWGLFDGIGSKKNNKNKNCEKNSRMLRKSLGILVTYFRFFTFPLPLKKILRFIQTVFYFLFYYFVLTRRRYNNMKKFTSI